MSPAELEAQFFATLRKRETVPDVPHSRVENDLRSRALALEASRLARRLADHHGGGARYFSLWDFEAKTWLRTSVEGLPTWRSGYVAPTYTPPKGTF